jgi:hypothetical protein
VVCSSVRHPRATWCVGEETQVPSESCWRHRGWKGLGLWGRYSRCPLVEVSPTLGGDRLVGEGVLRTQEWEGSVTGE